MLLYQHGLWENRQDNYVEFSSNALTLVPYGYKDIKAILHAGVKVYIEYSVYCHQKGALVSEPSQSSLILPSKPYLPLLSHAMLQPLQGSCHALNTLYVSIAPGTGYNCSAYLLTLLSSG